MIENACSNLQAPMTQGGRLRVPGHSRDASYTLLTPDFNVVTLQQFYRSPLDARYSTSCSGAPNSHALHSFTFATATMASTSVDVPQAAQTADSPEEQYEDEDVLVDYFEKSASAVRRSFEW